MAFKHGLYEWVKIAPNLNPGEWVNEYNSIYEHENKVQYAGSDSYSWPYVDYTYHKRVREKLHSLAFPGSKVLEIGCLDGKNVELLLDQGYDVTGIDIIHDALEQGNARIKERWGTRLLFANLITGLPFEDEYFDFTLCTEVLEHIVDYKQAIMELLRVTKTGSYVLISTPYQMHMHSPYHVHFFDYDWVDFLKGKVEDIDVHRGDPAANPADTTGIVDLEEHTLYTFIKK